MPEEVLRLKATVVSDEALASLRKIATEVGLQHKRTSTQLKEANTQAREFGNTLKQIGQQHVSGLVGSLGQLGQILSKAGPIGIGLGVVGGLAFQGFRAATALTQLNVKARSMDLTISQFKALKHLAEETGLEAEAFTGSMGELADQMVLLKGRTGGVHDTLLQLGKVSLVQNLRNTEKFADQVKVLYDHIALIKKERGEGAARIFAKMLGIDITTVQQAERVREAFGQNKKGYDEYVAAAQRVHAARERLERAFESVGKTINGTLLIALDKVTTKFSEVKDGAGSNTEVFSKLGDAIATGFTVPLNLALEKYREFQNLLGGGGEQYGPFYEKIPPQVPNITNPNNRMGRPGFKQMSLGGDDGGASGVIQKGVFDALVDYAGYASGGGGGATGDGFRNINFGGGGPGRGRNPLGGTNPNVFLDSGTGSGDSSGGGGSTRGDRNNNPGNLKFGKHAMAFGAVGADSRGFAIFPNKESGEAAQHTLLQSNAYKGLTLDQFAGKYAEGSQNFKDVVGRGLGIGGGDVVNNMDPRLKGLIQKSEGTNRAGLGPGTVGGAGGSMAGGSVPKDVMQEARNLINRGGSTGQLQAFMASRGYPRNGAWCGQFVASVVSSAGGTPPKGAGVASNWLRWGEHVDAKDVREGDVMVRKRSRFGGAAVPGQTGSHVALVGKVGEDSVERVGGNQGGINTMGRFGNGYEYRRGRMDRAIDAGASPAAPQGNVKINVNSNGTAASVKTDEDGFFQRSQITKTRQMQPTQPPNGEE